MAVQYRMKAPLDIWMTYGGDQQAIAQAMHLGILRPEEGVLAVMEGKRASQPAPQPPQGTVAQQVMGGSPIPVPQGLGANPAMPPSPPMMGAPIGAPPAPPMEAPMGAPPAPPMEAPMGMAMGGIASLPVPDTMFDEPDDGGYAGGGLVAFANGGDIDVERLRAALRAQESGGDYGIMNLEGSGAMGAYQFMPDTARALAKRLGLEYRPDLMQGKGGRSKEGIAYQERLMDAQMEDILKFAGGDVGRAGVYHFAGPNEKGWGAKTREYEKDILRRYTGGKDTGEIPERDIGTTAGQLGSLEDIMAAVQGINRKSAEEIEAEERVRARLTERASDEYYEQERKASMWEALASIGFNMAKSSSPYVLQAISEAAAATLPGAIADKKERKEAKDRALEGLMELGARNRKEAMEGLKVAIPIWQSGMSAQQAAEMMAFREKELASREAQAEEDRKYTLLAAAAKEKNPDRFNRTINAVLAANPGMSEYDAIIKAQKEGMLGGQGGEALFGDPAGMANVDLSKWGNPTVVAQ